jgi:hypothetical protein
MDKLDIKTLIGKLNFFVFLFSSELLSSFLPDPSHRNVGFQFSCFAENSFFKPVFSPETKFLVKPYDPVLLSFATSSTLRISGCFDSISCKRVRKSNDPIPLP